jgi:penicillin-binding protein 1C
MYVCKVSGCKASEFCEDKQYMALPSNCQKSAVCNYHKKVFLDKSGTYRVHADCETAVNRKEQVFFVLPPVEEWYYKANNMSYKSLPPYRADCKALVDNDLPLKLIYPNHGAKLYIPTNLSGEKSKLVFKAAHRRPETKIFWHLDEQYLGETHQFHKMECFATQGVHKLTLVDEQGNMTSTRFEVLSK